MTYYKRDLLQQFGDSIDDAGQKAAFDAVIGNHAFSSGKSDAVTYEGAFQRDMREAGLDALIEPLTSSYRERILDASDR